MRSRANTPHPQESDARVLLRQLLHHHVHLLARLAPVRPEVSHRLRQRGDGSDEEPLSPRPVARKFLTI
jgi:hypothetical protein